jgi:hypothetical protein
MAMRVAETGGSKGRPVMGRIEVASPIGDYINSLETVLTSRWCSNARTVVEPVNEAMANDGGASHWCSFTHRHEISFYFRDDANRPQISIA